MHLCLIRGTFLRQSIALLVLDGDLLCALPTPGPNVAQALAELNAFQYSKQRFCGPPFSGTIHVRLAPSGGNAPLQHLNAKWRFDQGGWQGRAGWEGRCSGHGGTGAWTGGAGNKHAVPAGSCMGDSSPQHGRAPALCSAVSAFASCS